MSITRRDFVKWSSAAGTWMYVSGVAGAGRMLDRAMAAAPGDTIDPVALPKFVTRMLIPPVMPKAGTRKLTGGKNADYYEISVKQLQQQILPMGQPLTTVWGYGPAAAAGKNPLLIHNAPSLTIEARAGRPVQIKWINDLKDQAGKYLPHLLPVDQTLHWAYPSGGPMHSDTRPAFAETPPAYLGPVPIVTHLHGAVGVGDESDGYPEAWFLPAATNIPAGFATQGNWYQYFAGKALAGYAATWGPGYATFMYPNDNRASTVWYHDHTLGMTRLNVYAGPAGFYLIRGGAGDTVLDSRTGQAAILPGPAPKEGDRFPSNKTYYEIPIAIQDRAFKADGSLFYPDSREFFDGVTGPLIPTEMGFSPQWNPEFFGNMMMVNGNTWPFQNVEQRRYRLRFLNGCQSRFLILDFAQIPGVQVWQIGNEGGFLPAPADITGLGNTLLLAPAERADMIVDFTNVVVGNYVLGNIGPDEPYGGGVPAVAADPLTTGMVMEFRVMPALTPDASTPPQFLTLPAIAPLPAPTATRPLALMEVMGMGHDAQGAAVEGPLEVILGTIEAGDAVGKLWMDAVSENPATGATEIWEFYNTTADAHPLHVHEVTFEVVNRQALLVDQTGELARPLTPVGALLPPQPWETGRKDTVTAYPGQVTRIKAQFMTPGRFVWHCHIIEHEDNEMMRPYRIGPVPPDEPAPHVPGM